LPASSISRSIPTISETASSSIWTRRPALRRDGSSFSADLYILRPKDAARSNEVALIEASNRGRKGLLTGFSRARSALGPSTDADLGDGFLTREGYTLVWVGWQFDLNRAGDLLGIDLAPATGTSGIVRAEREHQVLDGVMAHIGAGRLSIDEPAATPNALSMYAGTAFPYADAAQRDPISGRIEGLLDNDRARQHQPKVFCTNSAVEYWGGGRRAARRDGALGYERTDAAAKSASAGRWSRRRGVVSCPGRYHVAADGLRRARGKQSPAVSGTAGRRRRQRAHRRPLA
jgi:hypothetical protein